MPMKSQAMKITFLLPRADVSGGVRVASTYAKRLQDRGHQVVVVSRPQRKATLRERMRAMVHGRALPYAARKVPSLLDGLGLDHRVINSHRPITADDVPDADVIVATWWETAEWAAGFPGSKGAKAVFIQGYEVHEGLPADRIDATWRLPMHKIVIANWLADLSRSRFGDADISLVPNSVDQAQFHAPPRDKQADSHGRHGLLAHGLQRLRNRHQSLRTGCPENPGPEIHHLRRPWSHARPSPAGRRANSSSSRRKIPSKTFTPAPDAWLFPSRAEGFGLPILEAKACRTPVVATPAGAAPELLSSGGGILVPHDDPAAMAAAIEPRHHPGQRRLACSLRQGQPDRRRVYVGRRHHAFPGRPAPSGKSGRRIHAVNANDSAHNCGFSSR